MPAGRPPAYKDAEELQSKIDRYFNEGVRTKTVLVGKDKEPMDIPVPTITGLAYYLGFESRQSFYDYEEKAEFTYTIKRARLFIEQEYEMQLSVGNTTGAIFALKNMGWIDQQKLDHSNNGDKFEARPSIIFTNADKGK
jgi:hypothetical protein